VDPHMGAFRKNFVYKKTAGLPQRGQQLPAVLLNRCIIRSTGPARTNIVYAKIRHLIQANLFCF